MQKLLLVLFLSTCAQAQTLWKASVLSLAAANALDIHSSWGKHELNPALSTGRNATFGAQGALIKLGFQGGLLSVEYLITRGHPTARAYRAISFVNFGAAAGMGAIAAHNYTIARR